MVDCKGAHFPQEIMLRGVRWDVAYPLSTRQVEERREERGVELAHATINRWVIEYSPLLAEAFHRRKRPVWVSWRMDETDMKVQGQWRYLSRAADTQGQTIDWLLAAQRDEAAALRFLRQAIRRHGVPEHITIDGRAAHKAAITSYKAEHGTAIVIRKTKYLKNIVAQDPRASKRVTRPMWGFQACDAAQGTLTGIELLHRMKQKQLVIEAGDEGLTAAAQFSAVVA